MQGGPNLQLTLLARLKEVFPAMAALPPDVWTVGGGVRDAILGVVPADVDFAARDARQVAAAFAGSTGGRLVDLGRERFTTWRVALADHVYDFSEIEGDTIEADLARRDFTMNAIALEVVSGEVRDPFGGVRDIRSKLVRIVREENLDDDPLRVLKAARMVAAFGFVIEPASMKALRRHAPKIGRVAPERVTYEFDLLLAAPYAAAGAAIIATLGLDRLILGRELDPAELAALGRPEARDAVVARAVLMASSSAEVIDAHAAQWKWSEKRRREVRAVVALFARAVAGLAADRDELKIALHEAGRETAVRTAALLRIKGYDEIARRIDETIAREGEAIFSAEPLLSGEEIMKAAGISPGPPVGAAKQRLLHAQLRGEVTTREEALAFVRRLGPT